MTDQNSRTDPKSEMVGARVTADEHRKIKRLSTIRRASVSELLRERGVEELVGEYDRIDEMVGGSS